MRVGLSVVRDLRAWIETGAMRAHFQTAAAKGPASRSATTAKDGNALPAAPKKELHRRVRRSAASTTQSGTTAGRPARKATARNRVSEAASSTQGVRAGKAHPLADRHGVREDSKSVHRGAKGAQQAVRRGAKANPRAVHHVAKAALKAVHRVVKADSMLVLIATKVVSRRSGNRSSAAEAVSSRKVPPRSRSRRSRQIAHSDRGEMSRPDERPATIIQ
jgi:hypothetical protein